MHSRAIIKEEKRLYKMKTILCFGDSNTYGYVPGGCGMRFDIDVRYPGRLQTLLGPCYHVVEEGLSGRTTVFEDTLPGRRGIDYITPCVRSHLPIALVTLMLGTNDCKSRFHADVKAITDGMGRIIDAARTAAVEPLAILLIAPPRLGEKIGESIWATEFSRESLEKSKGLAAAYHALANEKGCLFLDAAQFVQAGSDMAHLEAAGHAILAEAIAKVIRSIPSRVMA